VFPIVVVIIESERGSDVEYLSRLPGSQPWPHVPVWYSGARLCTRESRSFLTKFSDAISKDTQVELLTTYRAGG